MDDHALRMGNASDTLAPGDNVLTEESPRVAGVQVQLPDFLPEDPDLWFAHAEAIFRASHITSQDGRFGAVLPRIPFAMLPGLRDIVCNPPKDKAYDTLKAAILSRFSMNEDTRLQQLLGGLRLGHHGLNTPSQLLSYMRGQATSLQLNDNVLRLSWLKALPPNLSAVLQPFINR